MMANWRETATIAMNHGYKYLSTPLVAVARCRELKPCPPALMS